MIPCIKVIINERTDFIDHINSHISDTYHLISDKDHKINIVYKKCCEEDQIRNMIEKNRDKDLYYHYATFGPHHDDYDFMMDGYQLSSLASQGQTRMVLIAFKLALMEYIKERNEHPASSLFGNIPGFLPERADGAVFA